MQTWRITRLRAKDNPAINFSFKLSSNRGYLESISSGNGRREGEKEWSVLLRRTWSTKSIDDRSCSFKKLTWNWTIGRQRISEEGESHVVVSPVALRRGKRIHSSSFLPRSFSFSLRCDYSVIWHFFFEANKEGILVGISLEIFVESLLDVNESNEFGRDAIAVGLITV